MEHLLGTLVTVKLADKKWHLGVVDVGYQILGKGKSISKASVNAQLLVFSDLGEYTKHLGLMELPLECLNIIMYRESREEIEHVYLPKFAEKTVAARVRLNFFQFQDAFMNKGKPYILSEIIAYKSGKSFLKAKEQPLMFRLTSPDRTRLTVSLEGLKKMELIEEKITKTLFGLPTF